jgi:hypothetical protein
MSASNLAYLKWLRQAQPAVYKAAVTRVARASHLGGLGDDLLSDISFDPDSVSLSDTTTAAVDNAVTSSSSDGSSASDIIDSLASAVSTVAPAIVTTQAQLATIQLNAQRAAAGLPPIGSTSLLTGQGLTGSTGVLLLLGLGLVAMMASEKGHGGTGATV